MYLYCVAIFETICYNFSLHVVVREVNTYRHDKQTATSRTHLRLIIKPGQLATTVLLVIEDCKSTLTLYKLRSMITHMIIHVLAILTSSGRQN